MLNVKFSRLLKYEYVYFDRGILITEKFIKCPKHTKPKAQPTISCFNKLIFNITSCDDFISIFLLVLH